VIIWLLCNIIIIYIVTICTVFTICTIRTICTVFIICTIRTVCALFIYGVAFCRNLLLGAANLLQNAQIAIRVLQTCCKTCVLRKLLSTIYICRKPQQRPQKKISWCSRSVNYRRISAISIVIVGIAALSVC